MLIEFSVSNYRSFREKQTLSMVATPRLSKKRNVFKPFVDGEKLPNLLKVAAIYGPNASGKSSLIQALGVVTELLSITPTADNKGLPVKAFRFDPELADLPSNFEYNFIKNGLRYQFILGVTEKRIVEERLTSYPKGKESLLYSRELTSKGERYIFGEGLEGGKEVHEAWRRLTSPKALFIAQSVANSSEELRQLREPFEWFKTTLWSIEQDSMLRWSTASIRILKKVPRFTEHLEQFLRDVDIPVSNIEFEDSVAETALMKASEALSAENVFGGDQNDKTTLTHTTLLGSAEFDFSEESGGTKNLIGFWLPWTTMNFRSDSEGGILAVDELDSSLHPEIVADLIEKHLDRKIDSQLIFTTHDTHLMNAKVLRRDQFWITERDENGATKLFSIHDFEGREGEDVEKRYFEGRYRGLPLIRRK
ncbi:AAA family ATPase [Pseudomonas pharyngis]|uniref:AAA family ATPase n=1 Tax=Pseudomonas pharyngis TaxID=2892333 RepID=UPI001F20FF16|nr:ATP-binding protein [Pseudomonas pharyngis]